MYEVNSGQKSYKVVKFYFWLYYFEINFKAKFREI